MNVPQDLWYTESHEWVEIREDGTARMGITDFAQEQWGDSVYVNLPQTGDAFAAGDVLADVESVKTASDIYAPVGGEVTAVNDELTNSPELVNENAYEAWFVELSGVDRPESLLTPQAYEQLLAAEE